MRTQDLPVPELARNMRLIGHCDRGGRPDGVQIMVHRGFAYVGHMFSKGFSVIDVRNPAQPKAARYVPAARNTWNIHLQTHDDLLLVINAKDMFAAPEFQDEREVGRCWLPGMNVAAGEPSVAQFVAQASPASPHCS
jgi:hypothetical protein